MTAAEISTTTTAPITLTVTITEVDKPMHYAGLFNAVERATMRTLKEAGIVDYTQVGTTLTSFASLMQYGPNAGLVVRGYINRKWVNWHFDMGRDAHSYLLRLSAAERSEGVIKHMDEYKAGLLRDGISEEQFEREYRLAGRTREDCIRERDSDLAMAREKFEKGISFTIELTGL